MDKKHYPYGFARSGDFSIKEAKILAENGSVIAALVDGKLTPETDQDMRFIAVAHGETEPASPEEKVWLKYQKRINRPKAASIYGSKKVALTETQLHALPLARRKTPAKARLPPLFFTLP